MSLQLMFILTYRTVAASFSPHCSLVHEEIPRMLCCSVLDIAVRCIITVMPTSYTEKSTHV